MTALGPDSAFALAMAGVFGVYGELVWPGRRMAGVLGPGVIGLGAALTGGYFLGLHSPSRIGLAFLAAAVVLFALDAAVRDYFVAGVAGTAAMAVGFGKLFYGREGITPLLSIPLCLIFGTATMILSATAKKARRNKRADIP
jgi:membrane-bound ClpP family serine protease